MTTNNPLEQIRELYAEALRHERHHTHAETSYWLDQYKLMIKNLLASADWVCVPVEPFDGGISVPDDDGEECACSMDELLSNLHNNGQIDAGEVVRVRRAKNLPSVDVTITTDADGDYDTYQLAAATGERHE